MHFKGFWPDFVIVSLVPFPLPQTCFQYIRVTGKMRWIQLTGVSPSPQPGSAVDGRHYPRLDHCLICNQFASASSACLYPPVTSGLNTSRKSRDNICRELRNLKEHRAARGRNEPSESEGAKMECRPVTYRWKKPELVKGNICLREAPQNHSTPAPSQYLLTVPHSIHCVVVTFGWWYAWWKEASRHHQRVWCFFNGKGCGNFRV